MIRFGDLNEKILSVRVPDLARQRAMLGSYDHVQLDRSHELANDPLVAIEDYGVDGCSYYARDNSTGPALPHVNKRVLLRKDVAERLGAAQEWLGSRAAHFVTKQFGQPLGIYVDDGLRSVALQTEVHDVHYPRFLRGLHPEWDEETLQAAVDKSVARGSIHAPHASGGAADVQLVYRESGDRVLMGRVHKVRESLEPDYYEHRDRRGEYTIPRRLQYALFGAIGLTVHPREYWHAGRGDKLSAFLTSTMAYYAAVEGAPEKL